MKFVRFGDIGKEKPGAIDQDGHIRDLSTHLPDFSGKYLDPEYLATLTSLDLSQFPIIDSTTRIGPCVGHAGKIVCIGLNYVDHINETGSKLPKEPVIFGKLCQPTGPNDPITIPKDSTKTDWEVELALVIGKEAHYINEEEAAATIAGYCIMNDVSERQFQKERDGQWTKGKSCEGFAPLGPWLVTPESIGDINHLHVWTKLNGKTMQDSNTNHMIFKVNFLISYISQFMPLYPGDIISTGTPPGVGLGIKPHPQFIKPGDIIQMGIEHLGEQEYPFLAYQS